MSKNNTNTKYNIVKGRECDKCVFDLFQELSTCISLLTESGLPDCRLENCHYEFRNQNECGQCGNTIRNDGEIFCVEIQSRVDDDDEACGSFSSCEPQYL